MQVVNMVAWHSYDKQMPEEGSIEQHNSKEPEKFGNLMQLSCMDNLTAGDSLY